MRLVEIVGDLWELTIIQNSKYISTCNGIDQETKNKLALKKKNWSGSVRFLSGNKVKSKAHAVIEIETDGFKREYQYDIYHGSKGFHCKVQGRIVYLIDIDKPLRPKAEIRKVCRWPRLYGKTSCGINVRHEPSASGFCWYCGGEIEV